MKMSSEFSTMRLAWAGILVLGSACDGGRVEPKGPGSTDQARWSLLVFMNGDNDLESYVTHDLNELERGGSSRDVNVVVQADRAQGYSGNDGDWTTARRYYIEEDQSAEVVSPVLEELGEIDMGSPQVLSDFLLWADGNYPADHVALILWNHGGGWSLVSNPPPDVSMDDTGGSLSIADGELRSSLEALVDQRGPLDLVGFDACNMGAWEVAHSLRDQALYMSASEAWVGGEGYMYEAAVNLLDSDTAVTGGDLAMNLTRLAVEDGGELTQSAMDLSGMDALAASVDSLAALALGDQERQGRLEEARASAGSADEVWHDYYLDLGDFADVVSILPDAEMASAGSAIRDSLDQAVLGAWGNEEYSWTGGLTLFFDTRDPAWAQLYHGGEGATWAEATRWDDLLLEMTGKVK